MGTARRELPSPQSSKAPTGRDAVARGKAADGDLPGVTQPGSALGQALSFHLPDAPSTRLGTCPSRKWRGRTAGAVYCGGLVPRISLLDLTDGFMDSGTLPNSADQLPTALQTLALQTLKSWRGQHIHRAKLIPKGLVS